MHLFVIIETEEKYWIYVWFFFVKIQKGFYHFENLFWSKLNNSISHSSVSAWLSPSSTPESIQSKPIFHPLVLIIVILGNGTSPYHLIHLKVIPWHNQSHKKNFYCNQPTHYSSFCCYPFFQLDIQFWIMSSSIITFKPILSQDNFNDHAHYLIDVIKRKWEKRLCLPSWAKIENLKALIFFNF